MLKSFTIKNFKSFKNATLEFSPFTLMIGANASGKSNALEALRVLKWLLDPNEYKNDNFIKNIYVRTGSGSLAIQNENPLNFICKFQTSDNNQEFEFSLVKRQDATKIEYATFKSNTNNLTRFENMDIEQFSVSFEVIKSLPMLNEETKKNIEDYISANQEYESSKMYYVDKLRGTWILDVQPSHMRSYSTKDIEFFSVSGSNTSSILYNLCQHEEDKKIILDCIQALPEQNITDIKFIELKELNSVILALEESFGGKKHYYDATVLSDGTLRVLAIITFLLSATEGSILLVEEIDNGIHPSRIKDFMQKIQDIARERKLQVVMTSHNPALLDAVPNESLADVVCCYRDKDEGDSRFVRLGDLYLYPELVAQGSLGDLVTQGTVEKFVHDKRKPEEHIQDKLAWFEAFDAKYKKCREDASGRG